MMRYCFVILISVLLLASCIKQQPKQQAVKAPAPDTLPKITETIEPPEPEVLDLTKEDSFVNDLERSTLAIFERHKNDKYFEYQDSAVLFDRYIKIGNLFGDSIRYAVISWNTIEYEYIDTMAHNILLKQTSLGWDTLLKDSIAYRKYYSFNFYSPPAIVDFNNDGTLDILFMTNTSGGSRECDQYDLYVYSKDSAKFTFIKMFSEVMNPSLDRATGRVYGYIFGGAAGYRDVYQWKTAYMLIPLANCSFDCHYSSYSKNDSINALLVEQKYSENKWITINKLGTNCDFAGKRMELYQNPSKNPLKFNRF